MKQKEKRFVSVRAKILWSLVFVSVPLMIAVVLITYALSVSRVEKIGMQLSAQYVVSAGEDIKAELRSLYGMTDEIMAIPAIRNMAQHSIITKDTGTPLPETSPMQKKSLPSRI